MHRFVILHGTLLRELTGYRRHTAWPRAQTSTDRTIAGWAASFTLATSHHSFLPDMPFKDFRWEKCWVRRLSCGESSSSRPLHVPALPEWLPTDFCLASSKASSILDLCSSCQYGRRTKHSGLSLGRIADEAKVYIGRAAVATGVVLLHEWPSVSPPPSKTDTVGIWPKISVASWAVSLPVVTGGEDTPPTYPRPIPAKHHSLPPS